MTEQPHHRQARTRTDAEQEALDARQPIDFGFMSLPADVQQEAQREAVAMQARARRQLGLPDGVDHAAAHHPDDPERAARHRGVVDILRGSLANQIARGREGR